MVNTTDKLGDDGELEMDSEAIQRLIDSKINTPEEWMEIFYILMAHAEENISQLTGTDKREILKQAISEL